MKIDDLLTHGVELTQLAQFGGVAFLLVVESFLPRRPEAESQLIRWVNNVTLSLITYTFIRQLSPFLVGYFASAFPGHQPGLLAGRGYWSSLLIVFASLEFVGYWMHRAFHRIPWLWRLHSVHHSDTEVDATTSFRTHPLEGLISSLVNLPIVLALEPTTEVALTYSMVTTAIGIFSHGNLRLGALDRVLRFFIVTPGYHCVHHSAERKYTDSNYCNHLPVYDYLFRTAQFWSVEQESSLGLGLERFRDKRDRWIY